MIKKFTKSQLPSNRSFGIFFSVVFLFISITLYFYSFIKSALFAFLLSVLFSLFALIAPQLLSLLNEYWYKFGLLLNRFISPLVIGFIFYLIITPIALITKIFGRDELRIKRKNVDTYWINRYPQELDPSSFKDQY
jgi:hypothetical protein